MRVYLGSDHAGFELKTCLIEWLAGAGHEPVDCGPETYVEDDDYPPYVMRAAHGGHQRPGQPRHRDRRLRERRADRRRTRSPASAPRWPGPTETARLARLHNDANVLSLGARMYALTDAIGFARIFVSTAFSGEARHARRLAEIAGYEKTGELPPRPS